MMSADLDMLSCKTFVSFEALRVPSPAHLPWARSVMPPRIVDVACGGPLRTDCSFVAPLLCTCPGALVDAAARQHSVAATAAMNELKDWLASRGQLVGRCQC